MDRHQLILEARPLIVALIRAGASLPFAAEAAGVPRHVFAHWLKRGRASEGPPFGPFFQQVMQARGQARAAVETEVRKKDPKFWLRYGPGKAVAKARKRAQGDNAIPPWLVEMLAALDPYPQARQALAKQVENAALKPC
jgi:hypothetical protein